MTRQICCFALSLAGLIAGGQLANAVVISTVPVGDPGNLADDTGYGSVGYAYRIGRTEITNAQYTEFLNAVAKADPYELYGGPIFPDGIVRSGASGNYTYAVKPPTGGGSLPYTDKPVTSVSWFNAIRFVNWLHNGQGNGDTETGAYTLLGGTPTPSNGFTLTRNPGAKWFLPTEDEWYKAAYFDGAAGVYYDYPTRSNVAPANNPPAADTGNSANFDFAVNTIVHFTDVGAYAMSASSYGTLDQAGNAAEWNESKHSAAFNRTIRGGDAVENVSLLRASNRESGPESSRYPFTGFRVASAFPEPNTAVLAGLAVLGVRRRRVRK